MPPETIAFAALASGPAHVGKGQAGKEDDSVSARRRNAKSSDDFSSTLDGLGEAEASKSAGGAKSDAAAASILSRADDPAANEARFDAVAIEAAWSGPAPRQSIAAGGASQPNRAALPIPPAPGERTDDHHVGENTPRTNASAAFIGAPDAGAASQFAEAIKKAAAAPAADGAEAPRNSDASSEAGQDLATGTQEILSGELNANGADIKTKKPEQTLAKHEALFDSAGVARPIAGDLNAMGQGPNSSLEHADPRGIAPNAPLDPRADGLVAGRVSADPQLSTGSNGENPAAKPVVTAMVPKPQSGPEIAIEERISVDGAPARDTAGSTNPSEISLAPTEAAKAAGLNATASPPGVGAQIFETAGVSGELEPQLDLDDLTRQTDRAQIAQRSDRTAMAADVARQVSVAIQQRGAGESRIELRLDPAELGRVSIQFEFEQDQVSLVVRAERDDALDLLRRQADQLARDLREAGFNFKNLAFGAEQESPDRRRFADSQAEPSSGRFLELDIPADLRPIRPTGLVDGRLDLRL